MNTERQYMTDFKHPNDENRTIAMAYVPWQQFRNLYDLEQALQVGTIFAELDKPFTGRGLGFKLMTGIGENIGKGD